MEISHKNAAVIKMVDLSTCHIPLHTAHALGMSERQSLESELKKKLAYTPWLEYGWVIFCSRDAAQEIEKEHPALSNLIQMCAESGIEYLKLDCDALAFSEGLEKFDWEGEGRAIDAMKGDLQRHGYFVGDRDAAINPDHPGDFMVNDPQDSDGFAIVGDDLAELIKDAHAHLELGAASTEPSCPRCSSPLHVQKVEGNATLVDVAGIQEFKCNCAKCAGSSFWI
jgi:hypothetical protein